MLSLTVEAPDDLLANSCLFCGISGVHHAVCQTRQLVSGQLSLGIQLISKPDYANLVFRTEPLNFFDDLGRGHTQIVSRPIQRFNDSRGCCLNVSAGPTRSARNSAEKPLNQFVAA